MTDKKETEKKGMAAADRLRWLPPAVRNIIITAVSAAVLCFCAFAVIRYGSSDGSDSSNGSNGKDNSDGSDSSGNPGGASGGKEKPDLTEENFVGAVVGATTGCFVLVVVFLILRSFLKRSKNKTSD